MSDLRVFLESSAAPIIWLSNDGSDLKLLCQARKWRETPVMIFPDFAERDCLAKIKSVITEFEITAYFFAPVRAMMSGSRIIAGYKTNCLEFELDFPMTKDTPDQMKRWRAKQKLVPVYLWDATLTTAHLINKSEKAGDSKFLEVNNDRC